MRKPTARIKLLTMRMGVCSPGQSDVTVLLKLRYFRRAGHAETNTRPDVEKLPLWAPREIFLVHAAGAVNECWDWNCRS